MPDQPQDQLDVEKWIADRNARAAAKTNPLTAKPKRSPLPKNTGTTRDQSLVTANREGQQ